MTEMTVRPMKNLPGTSIVPSEWEPRFCGVGELVSGRRPESDFMSDLIEVAQLAIEDAAISFDDIDTLLLIPCLHSPQDQADLIFSRVAEELGLLNRLKTNLLLHSGGSTSDNAARVAAGLIGSGQARNVLIVQAERWGSGSVESATDMLSGYGIPKEWEQPAGLSFNAIGALITARYMHDSGSTPEEMAAICVALRDWANLNPRAMYRDKKLTVDKVLSSKVVADPLHAFECPMLADGAVAMVMRAAGELDADGPASVRIAGSGGEVSHYSVGQEADLSVLGWVGAARQAFEQAGWTPEDLDLAEIYDSYAAVVAIAAEGIGISKKGEAARDFASGRFSPGGSLPVNTNGGLLSAGHTGVGGGFALLAEAVRQLQRRAEGDRQVADCRRAVVGGTGGSYMDAQVLLLERVPGGEAA
ncbi:MAG: acetyl-CoA acetyltransferase [Blastococcus sp.]|jgi:acetyl-CoA C-acetyltransferase|nr:acetyl-CoA acetyltransferase [Blastococcus sp.]